MRWLVQNLTSESTFEHLRHILTQMDIPWMNVKWIPYTDKIVDAQLQGTGQDVSTLPEIHIPTDLPVMAYGSYGLARTVKARGLLPGAFINEHFTQASWMAGWGRDTLLNGECVQMSLGSMQWPESLDKAFLRPEEDTKSFSGTCMARDEFLSWRDQVLSVDSPSLHADTPIVLAPMQEIYVETRLFVVNRRVVTGSVYKRGTRVIYDDWISSDVLEFAQQQIERWIPDEAFVLDIASTANGLKIIEVNNINSSGIYASNLFKIVEALENLYP